MDVLNRRVRVLSLAQIARTWCTRERDPLARAKCLIEALERNAAVKPVSLLARPEIIPTEPLATWQPGLPPPDLGAVAWQLQRRRRDQPAVATQAVIGSASRLPRPTDTTHDLHLAGVFLLMCRELPTRASSWVFETDLRHTGEKLPDAVVTDGKGKTVIECGGEYDRKRLEEDHEYFAGLGYGYEIW